MRFVVVADSHIRFPDDDIESYPSNALMLDRNRRVVEILNTLDAEFVMHLGDIVHPLPIEDGHEPAVQLAAGVYAELEAPIYYVPGNHDIGDKPDAMVAVPPVADANYDVFEQYWGRPFFSFDVEDCHFVVVDTPVLNSGLHREQEQSEWLETDLRRAAGKRIFLFTHYPPFVRNADENEHYDNLGEPARGWLLDLIRSFRVEAIFSGHVHNFLYNHYAGTDMYVLPATGFVRPDYSELAAVAPERELGRNDPAKLGFFIVDIDDIGHSVLPIRSHGSVETGTPIPGLVAAGAVSVWRSPIGVTLRHGWLADTEFPTAGLDEFRRKTVRNDATLLALWEARIDHVRIPVGDLAGMDRAARLRHLHHRGMRFSIRSAGVPDVRTMDLVSEHADLIERWELALWPEQFAAALQCVQGIGVRLAVAPVVPIGHGQVHHFVTAGFSNDDDAMLARLAAADTGEIVDELVFASAAGGDFGSAIADARRLAGEIDRSAVVIVALPRAGESTFAPDDGALADMVERVAGAAMSGSGVPVFLDGFMDHDRSYYPHHGLIDRRFNPRPALERLIEVASRMTGTLQA